MQTEDMFNPKPIGKGSHLAKCISSPRHPHDLYQAFFKQELDVSEISHSNEISLWVV